MKKNAGSTRKPKRNRRQTVKSMFIRGFLQSFFIVAILLTAGIVGYQTTMRLWTIPEKQPEVTVSPEPTPGLITAASVDEVSKNLIFCYDSETGVISKLVLEVFHCERKQLTYLTIPMSTQFTMSDTLYRKLNVIMPSIPQMLRLSAMVRYLDASVIFDYGVLMVEDMLGVKISYYTVLPIELYQSIFEEQSIPDGISAADILGIAKETPAKEKKDSLQGATEKSETEKSDSEKSDSEKGDAEQNDAVKDETMKNATKKYDNKESDTKKTDTEQSDSKKTDSKKIDSEQTDSKKTDAEKSDTEKSSDTKKYDNKESDTKKTDTEQSDVQADLIVAEVFQKNYIQTIREIDSTEEISTYIEEVYDKLDSNLKVREKMNYLESYSKTTLWLVTFTRLAGDVKNSGFVMDSEAARQQLLELGAY